MALPNPPLLFIHYGDAQYIQYTLAAARKTNPDKRIVLLGDQSNAKYQQLGIEHVHFMNYANRPESKTFQEVYRPVAGRLHMQKTFAERWLKFVFFRWFLIHAFLVEQEIGAFWTFDSDTLLLDPLQPSEAHFRTYDCTSQCMGSCMNGFISHSEVVGKYIHKILDLFQRTHFLEAQQQEFDSIHPTYAFTEMRAFEILCKEEDLSVFHLGNPIEGSVFDDCLACEQGYVLQSKSFYNGQRIKRLWLYPDQKVYARRASDGQLIQFKSLNLSWLPPFYITFLYHTLFEGNQAIASKGKKELIFLEPTVAKLRRKIIDKWGNSKKFLKLVFRSITLQP